MPTLRQSNEILDRLRRLRRTLSQLSHELDDVDDLRTGYGHDVASVAEQVLTAKVQATMALTVADWATAIEQSLAALEGDGLDAVKVTPDLVVDDTLEET